VLARAARRSLGGAHARALQRHGRAAHARAHPARQGARDHRRVRGAAAGGAALPDHARGRAAGAHVQHGRVAHAQLAARRLPRRRGGPGLRGLHARARRSKTRTARSF
jgi:hypothetical protein